MPREDVHVKGRRLLVEGRLELRRIDARSVSARCRGDSGELYKLGYYEEGRWYCACPARSRCSHLTALMLCVLKPGTKG